MHDRPPPPYYWFSFRWHALSYHFLPTWGIKEREKKPLTACCNLKKVFFVTPGHRPCRRLFTWLTPVVILWFRQVAWRGVASRWSVLSMAINQRRFICYLFGKTNIGPTDLWLELFQRLQRSVFKKYPPVAWSRGRQCHRAHYVGYAFRFSQLFQPLRSYQQTKWLPEHGHGRIVTVRIGTTVQARRISQYDYSSWR